MLTRFPSGSTGSSLFRYWWMSSCGGSAHRFCGDWQFLQRPAALAAQTDPNGTEQTLSLQQQCPCIVPQAGWAGSKHLHVCLTNSGTVGPADSCIIQVSCASSCAIR